jgi:protease I
MTRRILIVTGDAGESYETLYAWHRFLEAGFDPVIASTAKRRLHLVMHDFEPGWDTYVERPGYGIEATATFDEINAAEFEAIVLIGGRAPEFLRHNQRLIQLVREFDASGKWLFSICHGIQILVAAGVIKGRAVTCYEHVRFELELAGGKWCTEQAVRDGRLVSAQTWQSHPEFYRLVFECLAS